MDSNNIVSCFSFKGSKSVFQRLPIVAIVMEWFFKVKGETGPCPEEKVEELTDFLLFNKYVPFAWGIKENTIVRLDTNSHGKDWFSNAIIWLHQPSLPARWEKNDTITLNYKVVRVFA